MKLYRFISCYKSTKEKFLHRYGNSEAILSFILFVQKWFFEKFEVFCKKKMHNTSNKVFIQSLDKSYTVT